MAILVQSNKKPSVSFPSQTGSIVTFNSQYAGLPLKSHKIALTATQSGSGTPSPDNVRPISGWSAIHIGNISDITNISYFRGLLNGTYGYVDLGSLTWYWDSQGYWYCQPDDLESATLSYIYSNTSWTLKPADVAWANMTNGQVGVGGVQFRVKDTNYSTASDFRNSVSGVYLIYKLATPTSPTITNAEFEALCESFGMNGQSATIQIGSTVYGGEYDARTGVLTVTHEIIDLGSINYTYRTDTTKPIFQATNAIYAKRRDSAYDIGNDKCSIYKTVSSNAVSQDGYDYSFAISITGRNIYIQDSRYTVASDFKTAMDGVQLVYELATPQTIQLPPCPIDTLEGVNNIWADTGDTTLQYIKIGG